MSRVREEQRIRLSLVIIVVLLLSCFMTYLQNKANKSKYKAEKLKYDSVFVRYDSLDGKCIGSDYTFYCDSIKYWVVTKGITPFQQVVDTQYYVISKGKVRQLN